LYSYGIGTWEHSSIPFSKNFNYNIGVGVHYTIPFLGGSGYKTKMAQSDLRVDQITDERTQIFYDLKREIDITLNEIEDLKTEISNNLRIIKLSRKALDNASVIYQGGQGTIIDVLDAETILSESTINHQKSTIAYLQALSRLSYLTGNDVNTY
jgi:outer membrane protein TolC